MGARGSRRHQWRLQMRRGRREVSSEVQLLSLAAGRTRRGRYWTTRCPVPANILAEAYFFCKLSICLLEEVIV
ncbi:hypothetical protein V5799_025523 [Amblyomma americanum]|uniref:Uncharacterized protein n=1 Tax=Amblyomma americanum TaxID=6943 RepID=A0AAQ4E9F0_AMBAM